MRIAITFLLAVFLLGACQTSTKETTGPVESPAPVSSPETSNEPKPATFDSPKAALDAFSRALIAKDDEGLKASLSKKSVEFMDLQSKVTDKNAVDTLTIGAFTKMTEPLESKDEKIDGEKATLSVKEPGGEKWDDMNFVKEDGSWKLAIFDEIYDKNKDELTKKAEEAVKQKADSKGSKSDAVDQGKTESTSKDAAPTKSEN
ncbi:MAG: DUF2950 family protein [Pyrinomonadaceae bacterium]